MNKQKQVQKPRINFIVNPTKIQISKIAHLKFLDTIIPTNMINIQYRNNNYNEHFHNIHVIQDIHVNYNDEPIARQLFIN